MAGVRLVGGLGPESTIDYYRRIIAQWQQDHPASSPSILIDSLDVDRGIELVRNDRVGLIEYLLASLQPFGRLGMQVAVPNSEERAWLHDRYLGDLLKGTFLENTRTGIPLLDTTELHVRAIVSRLGQTA